MDVFGREKFSEYRDDMGGVGSFTRQNRTLYIGRINETKDVEDVIERHFSEWGEIERVRILNSRGVAFVTYASELNAQFAKEAMMCQSLDGDEVINVRWATDDPNPEAKVRENLRLVELGQEGIARKLPAEFVQAVSEMDDLEALSSQPEIADDNRPTKRIKLSADQPSTDKTLSPSLPVQTGLLSQTAIDSLRYIAASRSGTSTGNSQARQGGLGGLADYGSDEDE